jgi:obg-like ATPase 1
LDKAIKRQNLKSDRDEKDVLVKVEEMLKNNTFIKDGEWKASEIEVLNNHNFITAKNAVYLVNVSEDNYKKKQNKWLPKVQKWI